MSTTVAAAIDAERDAATTDKALIREFRLACVQEELGKDTISKYLTQIEEFRAWLSHPRTLRSPRDRARVSGVCGARNSDVVRFMSYLVSGDRYAGSDHYCVKRDRPLSASSRKNFLSALDTFYDYLLSVDLVDVNPTAGVKRPKVTTTPGLTLTAEELRRLLAAPGSPRDRIQAYLLAFTASRVAAITNLRWQDIDFMNRTITFHVKGNKYRTINIHPRLMPELRRWYLYQEEYAARYPAMLEAKSKPDTDYVLMTRNGARLPKNMISKQLQARACRAGLYVLPRKHGVACSRVTPHVLRRTFATILLNDGHHLDAVSDVLGHASVDTTRKHYAFSSDERQRETLEAFSV